MPGWPQHTKLHQKDIEEDKRLRSLEFVEGYAAKGAHGLIALQRLPRRRELFNHYLSVPGRAKRLEAAFKTCRVSIKVRKKQRLVGNVFPTPRRAARRRAAAGHVQALRALPKMRAASAKA